MADDDRYDGEDRGDDYNKQEPPRRKERDYDDRERRYKDEPEDRDRYSRDRDRERPRGDVKDYDRDYRRGRDYDRGYRRDRDRDYDKDRDYDRDNERHGRKSGSRSRSRSRSRDRGGERRRKRSGFDQGPGEAAVPLAAAAAAAAATADGASAAAGPAAMAALSQLGLAGLAGINSLTAASQLFPNMLFAATTQMPTQATRHARRVYVGGLPPSANEQNVAAFFNDCMNKIGGNAAGTGDCVVYVYINQEKKFAFVEMRTVEEASNGMALDGVVMEGVAVRVRRPSDYNPSMAAALGPTQPNPNLNLAAVGLSPGGNAGGADGPDRIFVGGLPYYLTEDQIRELLSSFGPLKAFDLVKDRDTGNSKGYGFCVYQDSNVTDIACMALNGMKMGDKTLTVRRATASGQGKPDQASVLAQAQQQIALQRMALTGAAPTAVVSGASETPTKVVCLSSVVNPDELSSDEDYEEILEDMREECAKYGSLTNVVIPRPPAPGATAPGVGKVYLEYADIEGADNARKALHGRKFGGNPVVAVFFSEEKYARGDYGES